MVGNVYVQFREEEHAAAALRALTGRFYAGRPIIVDFSPVTDFREASCRQYEENTCKRAGYCNFMHLKQISRELRRQLFGRYRRYGHGYSRSRSRTRSPRLSAERHRSYSDRPVGGHGYDEHPHGGRGYDDRLQGGRGFGRGNDRDYPGNHDDRHGRRPHSRSPGHRRGRSRSHSPMRNRSSVREGSAERRAKIEQWNREREQAAACSNANQSMQNGGEHSYQPGYGY